MKRCLWLFLFCAALLICSACAMRYSVTLNNGSSYVALGKPRLDQARNRYVFKEASSGQMVEVSPLLIREIAPYDMRSADNSAFMSKKSP
jgi:hypothetical protein